MWNTADRVGLVALLSPAELLPGLAAALHSDGWQVRPCSSAAEVCDTAMHAPLDVVVAGETWGRRPLERLDKLIDSLDVPLVALVRDASEANRALRRGAALALIQPVDPETLVLSIRALLRRRPLRSVLEHSVALGDLTVHVADHAVERNGRRQQLSPTEWQLLSLFMAHPGYTFSRPELARGLWRVDIPGREASVDLYVFRLRRKVERDVRHPTLVETVRNCGYRLTTAVRSPDAGGQRGPQDADIGGAPDGMPVSDAEHWLDLYEELSDSLTEAVTAARTLGLRVSPAIRRILTQTDVAHLDAMAQHCRSRAAYWKHLRRGQAPAGTSQNGRYATARQQHQG